MTARSRHLVEADAHRLDPGWHTWRRLLCRKFEFQRGDKGRARHPLVFALGGLEPRPEDRARTCGTGKTLVEHVYQRAVLRLEEVIGRELRALAGSVGELKIETTGDHLAVEPGAGDAAAGDWDVASPAERRVA